MGFFWLTLTLIGEILGYVLRYLFGVWAAHYLLLVYGRFPVSRLHPVTPTQVGWSFVVIGFLMHLYILAKLLPKPQQERVNMRPRQPSKREKELVEQAYKLMEQKATNNLPGAAWLPCDSHTMALIGWYLAEGYVSHAQGRGYHRVTFCLGHTDREMEYAREIVDAGAAHGLRAKIWKVKIGIRVVIENVKFARWLIVTFGTGASIKHLPLWLRRLPAEMFTPMLDAWVKGDGWYQNKKGTDTWKITTVSPDLAVGLREILLKMGQLATINRHHLNEVIQGRTVNVKPAYTVIYHAPREKGRTILFDSEYVYSRIRESVQRAYTGTVYNLEVGEDHSYCTPAFAVHNCIVPRLEGLTFSYDPEFVPAPILCDNNLSALPADYQHHIITRYRAFNQPLEDANSGFEPRYFDVETYRRWKPLLDATGAPWRFALDETRELEDVRRMMSILKEVPASRKGVYCLVGNEPIQACYERAVKIIEMDGEPFCQFVLPLNWLGDPAKVKLRYDWMSYQLGRDFCRYFNTWGWRTYPIWDYKPRKDEPPPFAFLATGASTIPSLFKPALSGRCGRPLWRRYEHDNAGTLSPQVGWREVPFRGAYPGGVSAG